MFLDDSDYVAFVALLRRAIGRIPMRLFAWCLMPNHFHFVLQPHGAPDLGRWMHWLLTAHVQRHRVRYQTIGRIWQGRFTALPIQQDGHLLAVLRYVERNPVRAGLVRTAESWPWSSMHLRRSNSDLLLSRPPIELPSNWRAFVNRPLGADPLEKIREAIRRGRPFGEREWTVETADQLGLTSSLRPRGRPRGLIAG